MERIIGSGGGKGGDSQHTPVEAPDSLRSKAYASVLDLVSEGPIEGPAAPGWRWVYLDDTPLQNTDGSYNFKGATVNYVLGDPYGTQTYIPGFTDVEADTVVGVQVTNASSVTRTISDTNADAARITIQIPQLSYLNSTTGDLNGNSVTIAIDVAPAGTGSWVQQLSDTITGKAMSTYERSYRVELSGTPAGGWDIRVRRVSADDPSSAYQSKTWWARYTKIVDKRFVYPNSAIVGINADAEQFQRIPTRAYLLKGLKVQVPVNYDPLSRTYSGAWDGTWKTAWTDNPAWCWYDMCTNTRYGAGRWIKAANLDKWALYSIAQYCDAYISAGKAKRATLSSGSVTLTASASGKTLTRSTGKWAQVVVNATWRAATNTLTTSQVDLTTVGLAIGDTITTTGFRTAGNNGSWVISNITAKVLTLTAAAFTTESSTVTVTGPAGDGFQAGDEITIAGFSTSSNNGRARVASAVGNVLTLDEKTLTNEGPTAACTVALQDFTEPRFSCNLYLQTQEEAINVIRNMASIFRSMVYLAGGILVPVQDAPGSTVAVFNRSNVLEGKFTYASSSKLARHTMAVVSWNDPNNGYKVAQELVMDEAGIVRYGLNTLKLTAMGCTSQGQAQRVGRWALYSERLENEIVTFGLGADGAACRPGDLIAIHDTQRAGRVLGGRVKAYTSPTVTLDREVVLEAGKTYTLMATNGTTAGSYTVTNGAGTYQTLTLSSPPGSLPQDTVWVLSVNDLAPTTWRVVSITEQDGGYSVEAITHNSSKFASVESGTALQTQNTSAVISYLPPQNLAVSEYLINKAGALLPALLVTWDAPTTPVKPTSYRVAYRREVGEWVEQEVAGLSWEYLGCPTGAYDVRVTSVYGGVPGTPLTASYTVLGKAANPSDVTGLTATWSSSGLSISWTKISDLDAAGYELRQGVSWAAGTPLEGSGGAGTGTRVDATSYQWRVPSLPPPTIWIKAQDTSGNQSTNAVSVAPTNPAGSFSGMTIATSSTRPA